MLTKHIYIKKIPFRWYKHTELNPLFADSEGPINSMTNNMICGSSLEEPQKGSFSEHHNDRY